MNLMEQLLQVGQAEYKQTYYKLLLLLDLIQIHYILNIKILEQIKLPNYSPMVNQLLMVLNQQLLHPRQRPERDRG
ncbi:MAG: hypothetical protein CBD47_07645 [Synechococcus sp. TMED187]|nr:MAG: hypothetical protein CBD47_07645 [Synechococcus sp. TMED187]